MNLSTLVTLPGQDNKLIFTSYSLADDTEALVIHAKIVPPLDQAAVTDFTTSQEKREGTVLGPRTQLLLQPASTGLLELSSDDKGPEAHGE